MSASDRGDAYAAASPAAPDGPEIRGGIGEMALPVYLLVYIATARQCPADTCWVELARSSVTRY